MPYCNCQGYRGENFFAAGLKQVLVIKIGDFDALQVFARFGNAHNSGIGEAGGECLLQVAARFNNAGKGDAIEDEEAYGALKTGQVFAVLCGEFGKEFLSVIALGFNFEECLCELVRVLLGNLPKMVEFGVEVINPNF